MKTFDVNPDGSLTEDNSWQRVDQVLHFSLQEALMSRPLRIEHNRAVTHIAIQGFELRKIPCRPARKRLAVIRAKWSHLLLKADNVNKDRGGHPR